MGLFTSFLHKILSWEILYQSQTLLLLLLPIWWMDPNPPLPSHGLKFLEPHICILPFSIMEGSNGRSRLIRAKEKNYICYVIGTLWWMMRKVFLKQVHTSLIMDGVECGPIKSWGELSRKRVHFPGKHLCLMGSHHHFHHPFFLSQSSPSICEPFNSLPSLNSKVEWF